MRRNAITLLLVWMVSLSMAVFAGTTGKLAGFVKDKENGEPLIGANILVDGLPLGATTDLDGSYFILNVPPGNYTLVVQYIGYQDVRVSGVQVSVDLTTRQSFELSSAAIDLGDEVVVVANRDVIQKDLTSSEARVTSEKIEQLPVEDIGDVLQLQAGVTRDAGGGFHIRGGRSSEISYWVNGISITDGFDNSQSLAIENESIQELQVISGTFNAEYGNAMSGIINVVTKEGGREYTGSFKAYTSDYYSSDDDLFYNIDDVNPGDNVTFQGALGGPVPFTNNKIRFFATGRYRDDDGYFYGRQVYNTDGSFTIAQDSTFIANATPDTLNSEAFLSQFGAVPMSWSKNRSAQAKLTYQATPTLKFNLESLYSSDEFQNYNHFQQRSPDGQLQKFNDGITLSLNINHTLSSRTFYQMNFSYLNRKYEQFAYESLNDPGYLVNPFDLENVEPGNFGVGGLDLNRYNRETTNYVAKFDLSSQIHKNHLIKVGLEARYTELFQDGFNLLPAGFNSVGVEVPDVTSPLRDRFNRDPVQYAAYIQDKLEYENVIINAGLRFDYFYSKGLVLADPRDPDIFRPTKPEHQAMTMAEREAIWYEKAEPKYQISPRLGIAYPVSESGVIHFSFGHFLQIPTLNRLFQNSSYKISFVSGSQGLFGNPDLDAESTVQYEIGIAQEISTDIKLDVTGFYRDIRDWVTSGPEIDTYLAGTRYSQYINKDYANVRGVSFTLNKRMSNNFAADLVYQFQVAEGTNSSPEEEFNQQNNGFEPTIQLSPLDWDQTHSLNFSFAYGKPTWQTGLIARYNSGLPFTPSTNVNAEIVIGPNATNDAPKNSRRRPTSFVVDFRAHKSFRINDLGVVLFGRVFNLLDRRNETNVFSDTGRADVTLLLPSTRDDSFYIRPDFYSPPRQVQAGLEIEF